ncbi:hypothetical protein MTR67_040024 [Solanum verrucosum]|uniref:Uncharacterized protein n=1 Tax=Solanum verrucosum TaxID=315347 RepID=A0AAF0ZRR3_SOLVR|nr:hypothetical protein MTR67_040024 [Solanum verrucosum]
MVWIYHLLLCFCSRIRWYSDTER